MFWVILIIVLFVLVAFVIIFTTKICDGGELISGCGKPLFIWTKKIKLPSGKYCCTNCYARDLKLFAKVKSDSEKDVLKFYIRDEQIQETDEE